jgi:hypothetical protein
MRSQSFADQAKNVSSCQEAISGHAATSRFSGRLSVGGVDPVAIGSHARFIALPDAKHNACQF